jgi:hypothetical protein
VDLQDACWSYPVPLRGAIHGAAAAFFHLMLGLYLKECPSRPSRWSGYFHLTSSGLITFSLIQVVARIGIAWPGMVSCNSPRRAIPDILFLALWLSPQVSLLLWARNRFTSRQAT